MKSSLRISVSATIAIVALLVFSGGCSSDADEALRAAAPADVGELELVPGEDPEQLASAEAPTGWQPTDDPLDEALPMPWPEGYKQPFAPWYYVRNAALLCAWQRDNPPSENAERIAEELFDRMLEFTKVVDGARFVVYKFEHNYEGVTIPRGWTSGLGNGSVIAGTVMLHECWPDSRYLDTAWELAAAYGVEGPREDLWFARETPEGFRWYEEVPQTESMILNGHIHAVTGLYYLWDRHDRDPTLEDAILRGAESVLAYLPAFRRPGQINCYDLTPPCHDDYGPARTVKQQAALFEITGDARFETWQRRFADDMGDR